MVATSQQSDPLLQLMTCHDMDEGRRLQEEEPGGGGANRIECHTRFLHPLYSPGESPVPFICSL